MIPFAALLPLVARPAAEVLWGYGAAKAQVENYVPALILFGPGLVFFTVHYLLLRGFYAREENRTVFFIQCAVAAANIVAAVTLVLTTSPQHTAPALTIAYGLSYAVGAFISYATLSHRIGGLKTRTLLRFLARLLVAVAIATGLALAAMLLVPGLAATHGVLGSALQCLVIGAVALGGLLVLAKLMRIGELTEVVDVITRRLGR
jgi:putative peptidoglycan lipid II flippase